MQHKTVHIDGDIVTYRCAAANENVDVGIACWQAGEMMNRILHETNAQSYNCFLTGGGNFRFDIYPDYKANRKDAPKPKHHGAIREYLATHWNAKVTDGYEADDAMGMEQCLDPEGSIIATIDKDLLMIPGWNYNFVNKEMRMVSPLDGIRHFYWQLIMGDRTDNIPGYDGKMRSKVPKFLQPAVDDIMSMTEESEMLQFLCDLYGDHYPEQPSDVPLLRNARCLWIWRKENDIWQWPNERVDGGTS